jgi:transcriptional regulator with XRE-family HTH domain
MRHPDVIHPHWDDRALAPALIAEARERSGISQRELGRLSDTSQSLISAYERGTKQPTLPMLLRLLRAAGMELRTHVTASDQHDEILQSHRDAGPMD